MDIFAPILEKSKHCCGSLSRTSNSEMKMFPKYWLDGSGILIPDPCRSQIWRGVIVKIIVIFRFNISLVWTLPVTSSFRNLPQQPRKQYTLNIVYLDSNFIKMSDVNTLLIEPLTKFVKDSAYLVKKCTKPDHKGIYFIFTSH